MLEQMQYLVNSSIYLDLTPTADQTLSYSSQFFFVGGGRGGGVSNIIKGILSKGNSSHKIIQNHISIQDSSLKLFIKYLKNWPTWEGDHFVH